MSKKEKIILRKMTDEELENLTSDDKFEIMKQYMEEIPYENTVEGLLKEQGIKYDDLTPFVLGIDVGRCDTANRTENQIYINRPNSKWKDNITINLNDNSEVIPITIQTGDDEFLHEEGYDFDGVPLYNM